MVLKESNPQSTTPAQVRWRQMFAARASKLLANPADLHYTLREIDDAIAGILRGRRFSSIVLELEAVIQRRFAHAPDLADTLLAHAVNAVGAVATSGQTRRLRDEIASSIQHPSGQGLDSLADELAISSSAVGIAVISLDDTVIATNNRLLDMLGLQDVNVVGMGGLSLLAAPGNTIELMYPADRDPRSIAFQSTIPRPDGTTVWISIDCVPAINHDLGTEMVLAIVQDISTRHPENPAHPQVEARVQALFQNTSDIVAICGTDGVIDYVSESAERILGYPLDLILGFNVIDIAIPEGHLADEEMLRTLLEHPGNTTENTVQIPHANGSSLWMDITLTNMTDIPSVGGIVITARDVTKRKTFEQQLERLAYFDTLTSLPNRMFFRERLDAAVGALESCDSPIAVVFIDLDRFKLINDRFGHDAGDSALLAVGQRISETLEDGEMVARLGGDEFAILVNPGTASQALATANRVLDALTQPFPEHYRFFSIDASAGVAVSSCDLASAAELLRAADIALYHGKRLGGGVATLYETSMYDTAYHRAELERDLQHALDRHEMEPWYQPEYDLASRELRGLEVLMRWRRPDGAIAVPADFLDVAIEMGIVIPLGLEILREACEQAVRWNTGHPDQSPVPISFNVSLRELHQPDYAARLGEILEQTGLEPSLLGIEIDDSIFREHSPELERFVAAIREQGMKLVLDGFSGGHASLPQIRVLRPDRVKIAQRAIGASGNQEIDIAILNVVTTIARALEVPVTAVGLSNLELIEQAREAGCHRAQCELLQGPLPAAEMSRVIGRSTPGTVAPG